MPICSWIHAGSCSGGVLAVDHGLEVPGAWGGRARKLGRQVKPSLRRPWLQVRAQEEFRSEAAMAFPDSAKERERASLAEG